MQIEWTDYMRFRAASRDFDLEAIERTVRYSNERYLDSETGRLIAIGKELGRLLLVAYEAEDDVFRPVTVHTTTRKQIVERLRRRRYQTS